MLAGEFCLHLFVTLQQVAQLATLVQSEDFLKILPIRRKEELNESTRKNTWSCHCPLPSTPLYPKMLSVHKNLRRLAARQAQLQLLLQSFVQGHILFLHIQAQVVEDLKGTTGTERNHFNLSLLASDVQRPVSYLFDLIASLFLAAHSSYACDIENDSVSAPLLLQV